MKINTTQKELDWVAGKETGVKAIRSISDWKPFLQPGEKQRNNVIDTDECVIFSATHGPCAQIMADISAGKYSKEAVDFFMSAGYLKDGVFNVSELFNAKLAGTTKDEGTYMSAMGDSFRHDGLLPACDLPTPPNMTWARFDAIVITDQMRAKAKTFLIYVEPQYQWVSDAESAGLLPFAPIQDAIGICPVWNAGAVIKACSAPMQHCVLEYSKDGGIHIQDTYEPFLKTLASDYKVYARMQYIAIPRLPTPTIPKPTFSFTKVLAYADIDTAEVTKVQTFLAWNGELDPKYICGVFGPRTLQAIKNFQYKYEFDILIPAGASQPTGKWGTFTIAKANALLASS